MYELIGCEIDSKKLFKVNISNEIRMLNNLSCYLGRNDYVFLLNKSFPSAYPCYHKAKPILKRIDKLNASKNNHVELLECISELDDLMEKQGLTKSMINKKLLSM